jgi:hypothetical protein
VMCEHVCMHSGKAERHKDLLAGSILARSG